MDMCRRRRRRVSVGSGAASSVVTGGTTAINDLGASPMCAAMLYTRVLMGGAKILPIYPIEPRSSLEILPNETKKNSTHQSPEHKKGGNPA